MSGSPRPAATRSCCSPPPSSRTGCRTRCGPGIRVGHHQESVVLVNSGTLLLVADSDRSGNGLNSDVGVIDVAALKAGSPAWCGQFRSGQFPRDLALEASQTTLLLGNFDSDQIESIDTTTLPKPPCG